MSLPGLRRRPSGTWAGFCRAVKRAEDFERAAGGVPELWLFFAGYCVVLTAAAGVGFAQLWGGAC